MRASSSSRYDKSGFRLRGLEMTRTEGFTDAAFAFAVTLLVISTQSVPTSYADLTRALAGIPAFAASFALVMMFWYGHWQWSRRFGLEDGPTIVLSATLVFVLLVYVYPLKYLYVLTMSGGRSAGVQGLGSLDQLYSLFAIYGIGFIAMNLVGVALNLHAYRLRAALELNELERYVTRAEIGAWLIGTAVGVMSVTIALFTGPSPLAFPGWTYMLMPIVMPIYGVYHGRKIRRMKAAAEAEREAAAAAVPVPV